MSRTGRSTAAPSRPRLSSRSLPSTSSTSRFRRTSASGRRIRPGTLAAEMDLERLVSALEPVEVLGRTAVEVLDLAYDARAVVPGALFFAVPGERADGHDFAAEAVERGAVALVVERRLEVSVPQGVVR